MKNVRIPVIFLLLLTFLSATDKKDLRIVGGAKVEFSGLREGDSVHTVVSLQNYGTKEHSILAIKSSCHCTVPEFEKRTLKPGEKMEIPVTIDTKGMSGRTIRSITIFSDESGNKRIPAYFILHVTQDIQIIPRFVDLQNCHVGKVEKIKAYIKNNSAEPVKIESITSDLPNLKITYTAPVINPGDSVFVDLEYQAEKEESKYKLLHVEIDGNVHRPVYTIPVYLRVYP